jgi:hypothetical protein
MFFYFLVVLGRSVRSESPDSLKRWLRCIMRSRMASAMVASPISSRSERVILSIIPMPPVVEDEHICLRKLNQPFAERSAAVSDAYCASAQASQDLPAPVAPVINTQWPALTQFPNARLITSRRSMRRPGRLSMSSMAAWPYFRCAFLSRRCNLRSLRQWIARSTKSAMRS